MRAFCVAIGLVIAGCSGGPAGQDRYEELLQCEMKVLVVAKFSPSLRSSERTMMNKKLASLSKSVLLEAASLHKITANIAEDQKRILKEIQGRVQGKSADEEAKNLIVEAKSCGN